MNNQNRIHFKQQGATLFVALILLLMMTLFAVSSINMSTVNLKIVGNMQSSKAVDSEATAAIEQVVSDSSKFTSPSATTVTSGYGYTVTVSSPVCLDSIPATGYSALNSGLTPEDNTWEIVASATDPVTDASTSIHSGVKMRMLAGNCP